MKGPAESGQICSVGRRKIAKKIAKNKRCYANTFGEADDPANIAYLQGLVAARLTFDEVLRVVVPKTKWWIDKWTKEPPPKKSERKAKGRRVVQEPAQQPEFRHEMTRRYGSQKPVDITQMLTNIIQSAQDWNGLQPRRASDLVPFDQFAALAGLILWAGSHTESAEQNQPTKTVIKNILKLADQEVGSIATKLSAAADRMLTDESWKKKSREGLDQAPLEKAEPLVFQVSLNRDALPALTKSVPAVKADAATTLFKVNCSEIGWAVLDSGIDGNHPAFRPTAGNGSRVKRSFDFKNFRKNLSLSNIKPAIRAKNCKALMKEKDVLLQVPANPDGDLNTLAEDARLPG